MGGDGGILIVQPRGWTWAIESGVVSYAGQPVLLIPGSGVLEGVITVRADGRVLFKDTNSILDVVSSWTSCVRLLASDGSATMVWPSSGGRTNVGMERVSGGQVEISVSAGGERVQGSIAYEALLHDARSIACELVSLLRAEARNLRFQELWASIDWDAREMGDGREEK
jgi:hypothetical protein